MLKAIASEIIEKNGGNVRGLTATLVERFNARTGIFALSAATVVYLVSVPLFILLLGSFKTTAPDIASPLSFENYVKIYGQAQTYRLLTNSLVFAFGSGLLAFVTGTILAWLVERTNTPLKNLLSSLILAPFLIPGIVTSIAWTLLLDPKMGLINVFLINFLGLGSSPFNIYTMGGMIFVQGLGFTILPFIMMSAAFRAMDASLEEAAAVSGAGVLTTMRLITIKIMRPAVVSSLVMLLVLGLSVFDIPIIIGMQARILVFSTKIYLGLNVFPSDFGGSAALGVTLLLISFAGIFFYHRMTTEGERFATITGKGYRPILINLGGFKYAGAGLIIFYLLLAIILPLTVLFWGSLLPYFRPPSPESISQVSAANYRTVLGMSSIALAVKNSLMLAVTAPSIALLVGSIVSWIVIRTEILGKKVLDVIAFIPYAIPGIVIGQAVMYAYLRIPLPIYGTFWILLVALLTKYIAFTTRVMNNSLLQIHRELEEAAKISGASWASTFTRIIIPLIKPAIVSTWLFYFVFTLRELSIIILLYTPKTLVLPVLLLENFSSGDAEIACTLAVMMIVPVIGIVLICRRFLLNRITG